MSTTGRKPSADRRANAQAVEPVPAASALALGSARVLAQYRRLILLGRARLPLAQARRIVGPDCAYHLYFRHQHAARPPAGRARSRRRPRRTAR